MDAEKILNEHRIRMITIIRKWCRNPGDFEDILQNIMLKIHAGAAQFEGRASMETWLYRVTVNESIDFYRRNKRHTEGRVDIEGLFLADEEGNPEKDMERLERKRILDEILDGLDEEARNIFSLYFLAEKGIGEIAGLLGISENAVRCRVYKAKQEVFQKAEKMGLMKS
jgi:RNA polymerase sigma-70 factor, ECF subfamily